MALNLLKPPGHVIYEMSAGKELSRLVPREEDYRCVPDEGCIDILQYIFAKKDNGRFKHGIIKVSCLGIANS